MACTPQELATDAQCIESCMPKGMEMSVLIALFCQIVENGTGGVPGGGTVTSFSSGNLSPLFTTNVTNASTTPSLTFALNAQTANTIFAGPTGGGAAAPTFRAINTADLGTGTANNTTFLRGDLTWGTPAGSGSVTSFSAGNLSPLFTTSVATATTTPALTFALSTQTANTLFTGPPSGGALAPTFRAMVAADLGTTLVVQFARMGLSVTPDATIPLLISAPVSNASLKMVSGGNVGFGVNMILDSSSFTGGRPWAIYSGSAADGAGAGGFGIYDANAASDRLRINTNGVLSVVSAGIIIPGAFSYAISNQAAIFSSGASIINIRDTGNTVDVALKAGDITSSTNIFVVHASNAGFGPSLSLNATSHTGGRDWIIYSGSSSDPAGAGGFGIFDVTAAADRMRITTGGNLEVVGGVFKCQGTDGIGGTFTVAATITMTFKGGILTATT